MIVEPFGAFAPVPALMTSTAELFTSNGALTVTTGFSPAPPVTVIALNGSLDAPAGTAIATGVALTATSARTRRRRRTGRPSSRKGGVHHATGGFDPLERGGTQHAWRPEHQTIRFAPGRTQRRRPASSKGSSAS